MRNWAGMVGSIWGIAGVCLLLLCAIIRLSEVAFELTAIELGLIHWLLLAASTLFMAYTEGYRGFQLNFSPRVAARCLYLNKNPALLHVLLAPLFCMGFFYTTRKRQLTTIIITLMIIAVVNLAHSMGQPWRGILDLGVCVGLLWGLLSFLYFVVVAFTGRNFSYSPELPETNQYN